MCSAIRIVVCAAAHERRLELRRATTGAEWEIVAAVGSSDDALARMAALRAQVLVVDAGVASPPDLADRLRAARPGAIVVGIGDVSGAAASVPYDDLSVLRSTLVGVLHSSGHHTH